MARDHRNLEHGSLDEEALGFLLGEEITGFASDGLEGSKDEHQIFTEVFYGKNTCHNTRTCADVWIKNYESDQKNQSSALVSFDNARSEEFNVCNLNLKQLLLSSERLSSFQRKEQGYCLSDISKKFPSLKSSKGISKASLLDLNYIPQKTPCRTVESFYQGIISSCYFPNHYDKTDGHDHIDNDIPSISNDKNDPIANLKVDYEGKASTIPVSPETLLKHLMVDGSNAFSVSEESKSVDSDVAESSETFIRELPNQLRLHAHNLLLDAGWKIVVQRRKGGSKYDSVFRTPGGGLVINSLIKAWRAYGELLAAGGVTSTQEENSQQWLHIDGFWHDLANALAYIKKETQHPQSSLSLLDQWHLLDPFMSVVCIDKKISALREGRGVKFVKGRLVELRLNKAINMTAKAGISAEKQPVKSTAYNRSSEYLLHCKHGNICSSVSSSLDHAVVGKIVSTVLKPEAIETSCNKKIDCRKNPECHMQVPYDSKQRHGFGRLNKTLSFGREVKKRSLKSLARSIGKAFHLDRRSHNMKHKVSANCSKQKSTSEGVASLIRKSFTLSKSSAFNVPLSPCLQMSQLELSKQDLKSLDAAFTRKFINHQVKKDIVTSDPQRNFCLGTRLYKEAASDQQTSNLYPKEKIISYGRNEKCSRLCTSGKTYDACNAPKEAKQLDEFSSSVLHRSSQEVFIGLASDGKVTAPYHYAKKEKNNVPEDGMKEKMLVSADSVRKIEEDILLSPEHVKHEPADAVNTFKFGQESSSAAMPVNKRASKRLFISDVEAIKLQHMDVRTSQPGENFEVKIGLDLVDKMNDTFDLPLFRGVDNVLKVETVSWSLIRSENHEVPNGSSTKSLGTLESSSDVTEVCTAGGKHEKCDRLGIGSVKINRKRKKGKQQDVKLANGSLNMGKDQEYIREFRNDDSEHCAEIVTSSVTTASSLQHTKTKKLAVVGSKSRMPAVVACQNKGSLRLQDESGTVEASFLSEMKFSGSQINQRTAKRNNSKSHKENRRKRHHCDDIDDDDLLISVVIKTKGLSSDNTLSSCNAKTSQSKGCRKLKSQKGSCKLRLRIPGKSGIHSITGARTPLAWLLSSGVVSLNSSVQCCNPKNNAILKDGRVTGEGILCKCCDKILSVSAFKCHAGYRLNGSSLNLFLESGKSYTLCQLQAWSEEYKARKDGKQVSEVEELDQNDDTCGLCGDGGELICCDNCPSTFHQACLHSQDIPEGYWYCPNCTCKICGDAVVAKMPLGSIVLECSQCEQKYHDMCLKKGSSNDGSLSGTWFCGGTCEKVYFGLRSHVGVMNSITNGFSWTILRCNHSDQRVQSAQKIALMADGNSKLAVALKIVEECFLPMVDPRTGINMIPQVLYNWGSNFPRLNYHGFYTIILEKDDNVISVATIRVHGVTVAEMPLIATCSEHRRQGMCRRLMGAIEEMLKSFNVEMLVLCAIPDIIDTWTSGFGFKPISDDEKRQLRTINLMLFPGTTLLTKNLCEALEMKKPEERFSSSIENINHAVNFCISNDLVTSQQPGPDSFTSRVDLAAGTAPWICTNLQPCEQEDRRQLNLPISSSKIHTVVTESEPDYVPNTVSCIATSNILGNDQLTDPRPSAACKEIRNVEGSVLGNIGTIVGGKMIDSLQRKDFILHPSQGDETDDVKITRNSEGKSDYNMFERIHALNLNNHSVAGG